METQITPVTLARGERLTVTVAKVQRHPERLYVIIPGNPHGFIPLDQLAGNSEEEKMIRRRMLAPGDTLEVAVKTGKIVTPGEKGSGKRNRPFARIILSETLARKIAAKEAFDQLVEGELYLGTVRGPAIKHNPNGTDYNYGLVIALQNGAEGVLPFRNSIGRPRRGTAVKVVVTQKRCEGKRCNLVLSEKAAAHMCG